MKEIYRDSTLTAFETEDGTRIIIAKNSTPKTFFKIDVKMPGCKAKTVATRCTLERAMEIARTIERKVIT